MTKKERKEAENRIDILTEMGLWEEVKRLFNEGKICLSEEGIISGTGIIFTFDEKPEMREIKEKVEKENECSVFFGVLYSEPLCQDNFYIYF